ncbi:hypothetical protein PtrM4_041830 [Pyrenophora tritici-repentis]|uniref:Uncharacterized protein n=1 Tax=Pyrenophora tritici-repentis TaxID=45151 RepID=A0A834RJP0_9PLEO|nr:hypothetical protein PtrM4_041830 [Pyrenophora tritici-repentis]KAI1550673.1 hypothetical protein PtrSN001C_001387 [Pyrenophora tritici-repentis]
MVDFRPSDAASPLSSAAAPAVKRKRLASCLGEQERRDRKRAIDREAQRSLREKTKAHIADLERTIEILRQQDSNGATASLLSEIDQLRAENVRLKEIIDSVRNLVGGPVASRNTTSVNASNGHGENGSSAANSITGQPSPRPFLPNDQRKSSTCIVDQKTSAETFTAPRCLDLDSMPVQAVMDPATANDLNLDMDINLELATVNDEEDVEEMPRNTQLAAPYAPLMEEVHTLVSFITVTRLTHIPISSSSAQIGAYPHQQRFTSETPTCGYPRQSKYVLPGKGATRSSAKYSPTANH